jgi:hypothetical protein
MERRNAPIGESKIKVFYSIIKLQKEGRKYSEIIKTVSSAIGIPPWIVEYYISELKKNKDLRVFIEIAEEGLNSIYGKDIKRNPFFPYF